MRETIGWPGQLAALRSQEGCPAFTGIADAAAAQGKLASFAFDLEHALAQLRKRYGGDKATFEGAIAQMSKKPDAYFFEVTDEADSTSNDVRERADLFLDILRRSAAPTTAHFERRVVDAEDFALAGAKKPAARRSSARAALPKTKRPRPRR